MHDSISLFSSGCRYVFALCRIRRLMRSSQELLALLDSPLNKAGKLQVKTHSLIPVLGKKPVQVHASQNFGSYVFLVFLS